jgi:hypothetical protein
VKRKRFSVEQIVSRRRAVVSYLHETYRVSERRACGVARVAVSTLCYQSMREPRTAQRRRMREIARTRVRYGYRKIRVVLNLGGWKVRKKLVYSPVRGRRLDLATQAPAAASRIAASPRAFSTQGAEGGVESRSCRRPVGRWTKVSGP